MFIVVIPEILGIDTGPEIRVTFAPYSFEALAIA